MKEKLLKSIFKYVIIFYFLLFYAIKENTLYLLIIQSIFIILCLLINEKEKYKDWTIRKVKVIGIQKVPLFKKINILSYPAYLVEYEDGGVVHHLTESMDYVNVKKVNQQINVFMKKDGNNTKIVVKDKQNNIYMIFIFLLIITALITIYYHIILF